MSMNIHAKRGAKIIVTNETAKNGYDFDVKKVKYFLEIGKPYTLHQTYIGDSNTEVLIEEVPNILFNSVNFEDYKNPSVRLDEFLSKLKPRPLSVEEKLALKRFKEWLSSKHCWIEDENGNKLEKAVIAGNLTSLKFAISGQLSAYKNEEVPSDDAKDVNND